MSDDFLVAHVLGMIAAKMDVRGVWMAPASLDRYLVNTGNPQILGLELNSATPLSANLLTDRMRAALCVPSAAGRAKFQVALSKDPDSAV